MDAEGRDQDGPDIVAHPPLLFPGAAAGWPGTRPGRVAAGHFSAGAPAGSTDPCRGAGHHRLVPKDDASSEDAGRSSTGVHGARHRWAASAQPKPRVSWAGPGVAGVQCALATGRPTGASRPPSTAAVIRGEERYLAGRFGADYEPTACTCGAALERASPTPLPRPVRLVARRPPGSRLRRAAAAYRRGRSLQAEAPVNPHGQPENV